MKDKTRTSRFGFKVMFTAGSVAAASLVLGACGGSTTTVVSTPPPPPQTVTEVTTTPAPAPAPAKAKAAAQPKQSSQTSAQESSQSQGPPNVVGMKLPEAQSALQSAGYTVKATNTDTAFGIVIPSHYTVCTQSEPRGSVVTVLAQKYGC